MRRILLIGGFLFFFCLIELSAQMVKQEVLTHRDNRVLSNSFGFIPYSAGETPSGGQTYSIPITTEAFSKFSPSIALVYNSQAGDGLAGYGWSISGLSSITLTGKTIYYNGTIAPPLVNGSGQVFALDGIPIVQSDIVSLQSSYPYTTARGNIQINKHTKPSGAISHFTALYPDGSKATFGWPTTISTKTSYPITQLEDVDGNKISFYYLPGERQYYPDQIDYDYVTPTAPKGKISFSYSSRSSQTKYFAGDSLSLNKVLTGITSYAEGDSLLAGYSLEYIQRHGAYLLSSLSMQTGTEELRPLNFSYPSALTTRDLDREFDGSMANEGYDWSGKERRLRGKLVKGEYNDGLVILPDLHTYFPLGSYPYNSWGSEYSSNHKILIAPRLSNNYSTFTISAGSGMQAIEVADVDGDGADEIIKVNYINFTGDYTTYRITIYRYNESYNQMTYSLFDINIRGVLEYDNHISPASRVFYFGRFDDTGHLQLLTISHNTDPLGRECDSYTTLVDLVSHTKSEHQTFDLTPGDEFKYLVYDLDNDGKTDVFVGNINGYQHYSCNSSGVFVPDRTVSGMDPGVLTGIHYFADMNGDGYIDIVKDPGVGYYETIEDETYYVSGGNTWRIYSYTGDSFVRRTCSAATHDPNDSFVLLDLNSDGLTDVIKTSGTAIMIYPNENGVISDTNTIVSSQTIPSCCELLPVNDLLSGTASHCIVLHNHYVYKYTFDEDRSLNRLVISFEDSFGNVQENTYSKATSPSCYHKDPSQSYSLSDGFYSLSAPITILKSKSHFAGGVSLISRCHYDYYNAVFHNKGLGFCGFGRISAREENTGNYTSTVYDPQKFGVPISVAVSKADTIPPYSTVTNTYDSNTTTYGKLNPRLIQSVAADSLSGITTTTSYTYGSYDLPLSVLVSRQIGNSTPQTEQVSYTYQNSVTPSKYLLGLVLRQVLTRETDGSSSRSHKETTVHTYDNLGRRLTTKEYIGANEIIVFPTRNSGSRDSLRLGPGFDLFGVYLVSTTRRTYDSHGNVTSEKSAPYGATEFVGDTLVYDSNGRYLVSKTDALGHTTTYSGYNKFGKPTSVTDYRNRTTTYTYDSWGNLTQVSHPDGGVEQTTTSWGGDGLYTVSHTATGEPETITHYDALGREVKSGVKRFNGAWQFVNKEYDSRGRLSRVSLPYRATTGVTAPSYWNTYHYDIYDRPDSLCEASGRRTRWSYNGTSVTTEKDSIAITKTTDAMGRVVSVSDLGGTTTYALRDDGQPSSITAPGSVVTTFTYDDYGRQTQMVDPSLGTETDSYTWNTDGSSQSTHTNRNGTVTTYKDKYGRTTQIQRANEFNTTYSYDTYGRLSSVSSTNSTSKEYTYDSYDRIATFKESVPYGKWLQKTYTYSTGSVLSSIAYTSQSGYITTETYAYANGHNTGITIPGTPGGNSITVWSLVSENDLGQPTEITTGGISREYGYTAFGLPTYRKMDGGYIQNFSFQFDPKKGNLLQRSGYLYNYTETFGYDGLNRLTEITKGNTTRQIVYANNGNITSIDGVGTLIYGGGTGVSPYEVTGLTPEQGQPSYRQRTVTYNSFDMPSYVVENTMDYPEANFYYNADGERVFADIRWIDGTLHWQAYAGGRYEHDDYYGSVTERLYLGGDAYSAPMVLQKAPSGSWTLYNIGRDYLGSITHITDAAGANIIAQYRYDPWGRLVDPSTGTPYAPGNEPTLFLGRGFTSHEHLTKLGLIYANARLYDPLLGRFLSPDPYVQDPDFSQNYNRYSYCLNNPLRYTDEDGEWIHIVIGAAVGGIGNLIGNWKNCSGFWEYFTAFGVGAATGALVAATGGAAAAAGGGFLATASAVGVGAVSGAINGATSDIIRQTGPNFDGADNLDWDSIKISAAAGGVAGGVGAGVGIAMSGVHIPININGTTVESPLLSSFITGGIAGGAGHIAGGTATGLLMGQPIDVAFNNSLNGIWTSFWTGGAFSAASTAAYCVADGINPLNGKALDSNNELIDATVFGLKDEVDRIQRGELYPQYKHDGSIFRNDKGYLPSGVEYREYYLPSINGTAPGASRIVVGNNNSWYYTPDHYHTFYLFKP